MTAYRIGDAGGDFPIWSAEGARRESGRWHEAGDAVIYASETYSCAMLEKLVHWNGALPRGQHFITLSLPAGLSYEVVNPDALPGWHERNANIARGFARAWFAEARSVLLLVPSVVARMERNLVINADHPEFPQIKPGLETPVWWDERLFS